MKRVLLVSAHPDDMEIGMGGTVAKMAAAGDSIVSVVITDGRRAPDPDSIGPEKMAALRKEESERAGNMLGVAETKFFDLESVASEKTINEATEKMSEVICEFEPDEIYALHPELDRHASHRAAGKICVEALKQNPNINTHLWAYEVWGLFANWDRLEDITDHIGQKLAAVAEHRSQIAAIPYGDGIAGLNRWRAVFAEPHQVEPPGEYAEVFIKLN